MRGVGWVGSGRLHDRFFFFFFSFLEDGKGVCFEAAGSAYDYDHDHDMYDISLSSKRLIRPTAIVFRFEKKYIFLQISSKIHKMYVFNRTCAVAFHHACLKRKKTITNN